MPDSILTRTFRTRTGQSDVHGRAGAEAVAGWIQEIATQHAAALGVPWERLARDGLTWVLFRLSLAFERWPDAREPVEVRTWPSDMERVVARRDFLFRDENGQTIGRGISSWVVMDVESRRPVRLPSPIRDLPTPDRPRALPGNHPKLRPVG